MFAVVMAVLTVEGVTVLESCRGRGGILFPSSPRKRGERQMQHGPDRQGVTLERRTRGEGRKTAVFRPSPRALGDMRTWVYLMSLKESRNFRTSGFDRRPLVPMAKYW